MQDKDKLSRFVYEDDFRPPFIAQGDQRQLAKAGINPIEPVESGDPDEIKIE
jgi:hypothetical protein